MDRKYIKLIFIDVFFWLSFLNTKNFLYINIDKNSQNIFDLIKNNNNVCCYYFIPVNDYENVLLISFFKNAFRNDDEFINIFFKKIDEIENILNWLLYKIDWKNQIFSNHIYGCCNMQIFSILIDKLMAEEMLLPKFNFVKNNNVIKITNQCFDCEYKKYLIYLKNNNLSDNIESKIKYIIIMNQ